MWRWEDVKMRRCEDEKMWSEKMWRWEDERQTPTIGRTLRSDALGKNLGLWSLCTTWKSSSKPMLQSHVCFHRVQVMRNGDKWRTSSDHGFPAVLMRMHACPFRDNFACCLPCFVTISRWFLLCPHLRIQCMSGSNTSSLIPNKRARVPIIFGQNSPIMHVFECLSSLGHNKLATSLIAVAWLVSPFATLRKQI